ncbi:hypothetical protein TNCV_3140651 [Trichonephila clavipes]|nr:hypothetical protein TNCV_3140651 [Trichonephila clavipes]
MKRTIPDLAPPFRTSTPCQREDSEINKFDVHPPLYTMRLQYPNGLCSVDSLKKPALFYESTPSSYYTRRQDFLLSDKDSVSLNGCGNKNRKSG